MSTSTIQSSTSSSADNEDEEEEEEDEDDEDYQEEEEEEEEEAEESSTQLFDTSTRSDRGIYTREERQKRIQIWREKKKRLIHRVVKYPKRKKFADRRPRFHGRFITTKRPASEVLDG